MFDWRKLKPVEIAKTVMRNHTRLVSLQLVYHPLWDLDYKLFLPRLWDMKKSRKAGEQYGISIYDANPAQAARKFSIGYSGQIVEKSYGDQWWLNFEIPDQEIMKVDRVKEYLQNYAVQMRFGFDRSTFYRDFPFLIRNASVTTGVMIADDDLIRDRVVFRNKDPRDHWIGVDQFGDVDIDHFELVMTAKSLCEKFKKKTLPQKVQDNMDFEKGDPFAKYKVILGVYRNGSVIYGSVANDSKPYISFYVMPSEKPGEEWTLLGKEGIDYKPVNLRMGEILDSGYPISMASDALTSATYGNALSKHNLKASHLGVEPPVMASETLEDQILLNKLDPNSKTFVKNADDRIEYLTTKLDYRNAVDQVLRQDDVVNDIFYITFLEMLTQRESSAKTLGEIYEMLDEKLGMMGPVVEATEDDALEGSVEIIAQHEQHRLPDMPQELVDHIYERGRVDSTGLPKIDLKHKYMGKLHRLKRSLPQARSSVEQMAIMKEFGDIFPDSLIIVEERKTLERILVARGMPLDELKKDAVLAQIDAEIQRRREFEEQFAYAERASKIIPSVTKDAVDKKSPAALIAGAA